jgi:hypothetical protein
VIPASIKVLVVESDDDVHRLQFSVPRYYGEFDLSEFVANINYKNARGGGDVYPVNDLAVSEDESEITFSWLVDRFAFQYKGDVQFSICLKKYDGDAVVKEFNTTFATLPVLAGLETSEAAVSTAPGVLDVVLMRLYAVEAATGLGKNGYYNVVKMEEDSDGVVFTILDQDGNTTATVKHGKDGYTPEKGVDYFTADEQNELEETISSHIKEYVDDRSPKHATVTLAASAWSNNMQTLTVNGVTADNSVFVGPEHSDDNYAAYLDAEVRCVSQAASSLTFKCGSTPSVDLLVNVTVM